ncbi:MAG TPA: glucuronate isomerase [Candidatus Bathyarchaeia archaeon]|nr:glucuronate isomerase [Candidatus Bathyarchaeia archaeon]
METISVKTSDAVREASNGIPLTREQIQPVVEETLSSTPFIDIHTHLYAPSFGKIGLWGIDELLTYHYLEAEFFRSSDLKPEQFWNLSKTEQADRIWRALFIENTPISEATRGVVAVLQAFDLPTDGSGLAEARAFFKKQSLEPHVRKVFQMAGISEVVMTNDPLDPEEAPLWLNGEHNHPQFHAVLRLDRILRGWSTHWQELARQGYAVDEHATGKSVAEVRRFLDSWYERMRPLYMAVSLTDAFQYPDDSMCSKLLREAVLPSCREFNLPMSLMIGVRPQVNPAIRLAGDAVGRVDLRALENVARSFPDNRFLVSLLSRENQHELCVYSRKFNNLMPFGCWWFMNNLSIVEEITRERLEMLGASFIPQHSDARVLEQVIYKWRNTRRVLGHVLSDFYKLMLDDGRAPTKQEIQRDVKRLFRTNFAKFVGRQLD